MNVGNNIITLSTRQEWREWLMANFETESEVWFTFPLKASGNVGVTYNDAVEEALCFEWIDGVTKTIDGNHRIQRFTPRKPKTNYSQANKERLKWLLDRDLIHPKFKIKIGRAHV